MKNSQFNAQQIKNVCENKLEITFGGSKEYNGWYFKEGIKINRITIPKGRKYVPPGTYGNMAKQLNLSIFEFDGLLGCSVNREDYDNILIKKKILESVNN